MVDENSNEEDSFASNYSPAEIDQKALDLAVFVAKKAAISDPIWIARIQLAIIDGIKNGVKASVDLKVE